MRTHAFIASIGCLAAGLVAQTLTAWALFIHSAYTGGTGVLNNPPLKPGEITDTGFVVPADWTSRTRLEWWGVGKTRETVSEAEWMGSRPGMTEGGGRQATYNGFSAGWPLRSFQGSDYLTPGVQTVIPPVLADVPAWIKAGGHKVPIAPRWPALLANTLLFSLPFAAGWTVFSAWRRAHLRRRGLCLACGYNATGLDRCPECGRATAVNAPKGAAS